MTKQNIRNRKAKRWTRLFTAEENNDRNNREIYPSIPSPKGIGWLFYIQHRLKMMEQGIAVYTTDKYTRLDFDKYVESNRVCDTIAGMLTNHQPTLVHFGGAQTAPNSPIGIKKGLRCPGNRKMLRSYKKCRHCHVNIVDEYYTSQTCAKCFKRFNPRTKRDRYKMCIDCQPHPDAMLPSIIVAKRGKRLMRKLRLMDFLTEKEFEECDDSHAIRPNTENLLSTVGIYQKKWLVNPVNGVLEYVNAEQTEDMDIVIPQIHKTVWHRDIVAAKCILIKGHCDLFGIQIAETLQRPHNHPVFIDN